MIKRKKNTNSLSNQKPTRRLRSKLIFKIARKALYATTTISFAIGSYYLFLNLQNKLKQQNKDVNDWSFIIHLSNKSTPAESEKKRIISILKKGLSNQTIKTTSYQSIAEKLLMQSNYGSAHILKISDKKFVINLKTRTPRFAVKADKLRVISASGIVYGSYKKSLGLPLLKGVFRRPKSAFRINKNNSLILSEDEQNLINEALLLSKVLLENSLKTKSITFERYRGFFADIPHLNLEVSFGRKPFQTKITKLFKVLSKLRQSGKVASRIELDYDGKAFVREKNNNEKIL